MNYEEYFLLYADKELSGTAMKAVEEFVAAHPELQRELDDLLSTVQQPNEAIAFPLKDALMKNTNEGGTIIEEDYESLFVRCLDDELNEEEKIFTEKLLKAHPKYQPTFDALQSARLEPDRKVVFPDKQLLYRRETKVITFHIWQYAAAAALVGALLWVGIDFFRAVPVQPVAVQIENSTPTQEQVVKNEPAQPQPQQEPSRTAVVQDKAKKDTPLKSKESEVKEQEKIAPAPIVEYVVNVPYEGKQKTPEAPKEISDEKEILPGVPHLPVDYSVGIAAMNQSTEPLQTPEWENTISFKEAKENAALVQQRLSGNKTNENVLNVPKEKLKKSKLGILVKQVRRVVKRNNPLQKLFEGSEEVAMK